MAKSGHAAVLRDVTVRYKATTALQSIDLSIEHGEIVGIVGESGAGKSTMLRLLDATEQPTEGTVLLDGVDPATLGERGRRRIRHRIGMVFQGFNLLSNRTVEQNIELPLRLQRRRDPELVAKLIDYVGLADRAKHYPAQLSGGQKQRVAIARALITQPTLLLADEPTSALDERTTAGILSLLERTRRDFGTTIVLVTHELAAVKAVCDRAVILERGELRDIVQVVHGETQQGASYLDRAKQVLES